MGEAHLGDVGDELRRRARPGEERAVVAPPPGAEVHLVDRDRRAAGRRPRPRTRDTPRRSSRAELGARPPRRSTGAAPPAKRERDRPSAAAVRRRRRRSRTCSARPRRRRAGRSPTCRCRRACRIDVAPAVPGVEVADHAHPLRVRRPDGEMHALGALVADRVRAHAVEEPQVAALAGCSSRPSARAPGRRYRGRRPTMSPPALRAR